MYKKEDSFREESKEGRWYKNKRNMIKDRFINEYKKKWRSWTIFPKIILSLLYKSSLKIFLYIFIHRYLFIHSFFWYIWNYSETLRYFYWLIFKGSLDLFTKYQLLLEGFFIKINLWESFFLSYLSYRWNIFIFMARKLHVYSWFRTSKPLSYKYKSGRRLDLFNPIFLIN